jgi:hypothetical protein
MDRRASDCDLDELAPPEISPHDEAKLDELLEQEIAARDASLDELLADEALDRLLGDVE